MKYQSTRGSEERIESAEAIASGLARDGGLYVPETLPVLSQDKLNALVDKPYSQKAAEILRVFLNDFGADELDRYSQAAYNDRIFDNSNVAPLYKTGDSTFFLELWHGPTAAFKDMALSIMPRLLTASLKKTGEEREACILTATSGDTGKAALEGFCDVPGTRIMVFYPHGGVSDIQKLQMTSQRGDNVNVTAVKGNFDDTQTGVKAIFTDKTMASEIEERGFFLSSANSINWGRLVPQVAYYVSSYCELVKTGVISAGEKINFCVPTGNFGNILAGYYARQIGLPIGKLICASNRNDVLTQFINTGVYDRNRAFYKTISPSMDILVSSNLERLLFELSNKDGSMVSSYMSALAEKGHYDVPGAVLAAIRDVFACAYCSEEDTQKTIADTWRTYDYLIDTHTAVAFKALNDYRVATGDDSVSVIISTASPFKFAGSVLEALGQPAGHSGMGLIDELQSYTGVKAPLPLSELGEQKERFDTVIEIGEMKEAVLNFLCK